MYIYTKHALEKMDALGLDKREVETTIVRGMKWKEHDREMWHAQMAGTEVVFIKEEEGIFIITVYLGERSK